MSSCMYAVVGEETAVSLFVKYLEAGQLWHGQIRMETIVGAQSCNQTGGTEEGRLWA